MQTRIYLYFKKTKHQIVLPNEQENTHPQHIFPNQIKHQVFSTAPSSSILKKRQEDPCCRSSGDPELRIHYKVDPKNSRFIWYRTGGYVIKPPVGKNGPKIQGYKAISIYKWGAFLHAGKKNGGVMGEDPTYTWVFGSTL